MRMFALSIVISVAAISPGVAAFEPEISAICVPAPIPPGSRGRIELNRLMDELLASRQVGFGDLRGTISYDDKRAAITDPPTFCSKRSGVCGEGALRKLALAYQDLVAFIQAHRAPVAANASGYEIRRNGSRSEPISVREFLSGGTSAVCVVAPVEPGMEKPAKPNTSGITRRVMVRKKIDDLQVPQGSDRFKDLDRASVSVESDFLQKSHTYNINGVVGYAIGGIPVGTGRAEWIAFGSYTRQFVAGKSASGTSDIHNIGGGVLNSYTFLGAGERHNLQFFAHYLHSERTAVDTLSGYVIYKLLTGWGIGQPVYLGGSTYAFQFVPPQLKYAYSHVLNNGNGMPLAPGKDYQRMGGRLEALFIDDGGVFDRFSLRASYEILYLVGAPVRTADRFEATLSYTFPSQEFWSFDIKFWNGRNLDTFEREKAMTAGVGFKY